MNLVPILKTEASGLWDGGRGLSLVMVATAWGLLVGTRMIYPVIIPYLQTVYGITLSVAGLLVSVLWLCGAIGQLPGGILADKYNERILLAGSPLIVAAAIVILITSPTLSVLFAATALWGIGHSLYPIPRITFLSTAYADRLGSALGVTMATGDIGQTIVPPIAAVIAVLLAWRAGVAFMIPFLLLASLGLYLILPRHPRSTRNRTVDSDRRLRSVISELFHRDIGFMTVILFFYILIWQTFTAFYPTYLISMKGLTPTIASVLFGFYFAVGVVVKPIAGAAYDRIGMRGSLIGVLLPPIAGFVLLPFTDGFWPLVIVTALVSTMLGSGAITQSYLAESFSADVRGTGLGAVRTGTATVAAAGPIAFGILGDYGYFDEGYLVFAAVMGAIILLTLGMPNRRE